MAFKLSLFLAELKRRKVYRVAAVYIAVGVAISLGVPDLFSAFDLPSSAARLVIILVVIGFPIALVLAWAYEVRPEEPRKAEPKTTAVIDTPDAGKRKSIAVLPFVDLSPEKDQEYFCDGVTEEIIDWLSRLHDLDVVARTSTFVFKGHDQDARSIGKDLQVDAILEGSVRKAGERLRITAQVINTADGYHLWSERYDRDLQDVFEVQENIARRIAERLTLGFSSKQDSSPVKRHSSDLEAYHLYLKGRYAWTRREKGLLKAKEHFEQAIQVDPRYSLAYAGLADCYNLIGWYGVASPGESYPQAEDLATKAIEIDDSLAEGHTSLAFAKMIYAWEWGEAERLFLRSMELNPRYPTNHHWYSEYLMAVGRVEAAISAAREAQALDPLGLIINTVLGMALYHAREFDEAIKELSKILEMESDFVPAQIWLGLSQVMVGNSDKAIELFRKSRTLSEDRPGIVALLAYAQAVSGRKQEAAVTLNELEEMSKRRYVARFDLARIHAALGDTSRTLELLEAACKERSSLLAWVKVDPTLDMIRDQPRFQGVLRHMNVPD